MLQVKTTGNWPIRPRLLAIIADTFIEEYPFSWTQGIGHHIRTLSFHTHMMDHDFHGWMWGYMLPFLSLLVCGSSTNVVSFVNKIQGGPNGDTETFLPFHPLAPDMTPNLLAISPMQSTSAPASALTPASTRNHHYPNEDTDVSVSHWSP